MCGEFPRPEFSCVRAHIRRKETRTRKKTKVERRRQSKECWERPPMLAYIPPHHNTRTYLWYRFQWSICSFFLSLSTWHHPLRRSTMLWGSLIFILFFFPTWYFYLSFSHQKNHQEFLESLSYCSMRNDPLFFPSMMDFIFGEICARYDERDKISRFPSITK